MNEITYDLITKIREIIPERIIGRSISYTKSAIGYLVTNKTPDEMFVMFILNDIRLSSDERTWVMSNIVNKKEP